MIQIEVNGQEWAVPEQITVAQLLEQLGLANRPVAVEINGELVPRGEHAKRQLVRGDRVEIVTLVGGG